MEYVIAIMNTDAAVATIAAICIYALGRVFAKYNEAQTFWSTNKETLLKAVEAIEKNIDDDTTNPTLAKVDDVAEYLVKVLNKVNAAEIKADSTEVVEETKEG
jgi:hypothetical protein